MYRWLDPARLYNLYNYYILDYSAFIWLWYNANLFEVFIWNTYTIFFQLESVYYFLVSSISLSKLLVISMQINSYYYYLFLKFIKFSFFFLLIINLFFFLRNSTRNFIWSNNLIFSKIFFFFETEEELGSFDDIIFFVMLFVMLLIWYFLTSYLFINIFNISLSLIVFTFFILVFFVLLIPFSVLLDFGLAFTSYIRGAAPSTNIIVETIFDLIGVLVVFTRFIVQNIRFVLIFAAYFELFEWVYDSPYIHLFNSFFNLTNIDTTILETLNFSSIFYTFSIILSGILLYLYYFIHLLLLLFIQLGAYFLISFWLFFFFYTSFTMTKVEKFFFYKRHLTL